jgi:hypothetical protein
MRNAAARTPHANPTESKSRFNIIGKQTPPNEDPETVIPIANPRFFRNHVFIHRMAVLKLLVRWKGKYDTLVIILLP